MKPQKYVQPSMLTRNRRARGSVDRDVPPSWATARRSRSCRASDVSSQYAPERTRPMFSAAHPMKHEA